MTDRRALTAVWIAALAAVVVAPLAGWPAVLRVGAVLTAASAASTVIVRPWTWSPADWDRLADWRPSPREVLAGSVAVGLVLFWIVLARFESGETNAVDFTVYFDRPSFQTAHGRPLFVETADVPGFSHQTELAVHAYWAMIPIGCLYLIAATPYWLLALSVIAVVVGAVYMLRITARIGLGGLVGCACALAFVLNDNTARALNYGFHPELLYAWFIPWMIDAAGRGARGSFVAAAIGCVLVKEDAVMPLFAVAVALALWRRSETPATDRALFAAMPVALALVNLVLYVKVVLPRVAAGGVLSYSSFWAHYGATPFRAAVAMLQDPAGMTWQTITSGFLTRVLPPHLFLPLIGWRWSIGIVPTVVVYSASINPRLRAFGLYYAIVLVPFLVLAAAAGAMSVTNRLFRSAGRAQGAAACLLVGGALLTTVVENGYSVRPWRREIRAVPVAIGALGRDRPILVQSALYPHAGYDPHVRLLTLDAVHDAPDRTAILLARGLSAYPLTRGDLDALLRLDPIAPLPSGLVAVAAPRLK